MEKEFKKVKSDLKTNGHELKVKLASDIKVTDKLLYNTLEEFKIELEKVEYNTEFVE